VSQKAVFPCKRAIAFRTNEATRLDLRVVRFRILLKKNLALQRTKNKLQYFCLENLKENKKLTTFSL
jgi:hypothetical protein